MLSFLARARRPPLRRRRRDRPISSPTSPALLGVSFQRVQQLVVAASSDRSLDFSYK